MTTHERRNSRTRPRKTSGTSIRVHPETHAVLSTLAKRTHLPLTQYLARLAEQEQRRQFFADLNAAVERLQADPEAWAEYERESKQLEGTLLDGLEEKEDWSGVFDGPTAPW